MQEEIRQLSEMKNKPPSAQPSRPAAALQTLCEARILLISNRSVWVQQKQADSLPDSTNNKTYLLRVAGRNLNPKEMPLNYQVLRKVVD